MQILPKRLRRGGNSEIQLTKAPLEAECTQRALVSVAFKVRSLARPARRSPRPVGRRSRRQSQSRRSRSRRRTTTGHSTAGESLTELGANGLLRKPRLQVAWVSEGTFRRALFCSATVLQRNRAASLLALPWRPSLASKGNTSATVAELDAKSMQVRRRSGVCNKI